MRIIIAIKYTNHEVTQSPKPTPYAVSLGSCAAASDSQNRPTYTPATRAQLMSCMIQPKRDTNAIKRRSEKLTFGAPELKQKITMIHIIKAVSCVVNVMIEKPAAAFIDVRSCLQSNSAVGVV